MASQCYKFAMARLQPPVDPPVEKTAQIPWDGKLAMMRDSALIAWQAGELLAKQAGIGSIAKDVVKLPMQMAGHGIGALWKGTSAATKAKIGLTGVGLGVGAAGLGLGHIGSNAVGALSNASSVPDEQAKQAGVGDALKSLTQWAKAKPAIPSLTKDVIKGSVSSGSGLLKGPSLKSAPKRTANYQKIPSVPTGQINKPPAGPPAPVAVPQAPPMPQQNGPGISQQATQPVGQPPTQHPPVGTVGQKGQQAAVQSADQGAAATQTPQDAGRGGALSKLRGAVPWALGTVGLGVGGTLVGASMLGNRALKEMGRDGQLNNSYQGYGAPVSGSASPYGYVSGPSG